MMKPQALIFDIDDTLVDVTNSYRLATVATGKYFGEEITFEDIAAAKAAGDANNDWVLTRDLLLERGVDIPLASVTEKFEECYQGTEDKPGMRSNETLLIDPSMLETLAQEYKMGIVTGRPRKDAQMFLDAHGLGHLFFPVVTMDDAPLKPDPGPVLFALAKLGVKSAWMFGDTPDDIRAAVGAGVTAVGVIAPADSPQVATKAMMDAGAYCVIEQISRILDVLPK